MKGKWRLFRIERCVSGGARIIFRGPGKVNLHTEFIAIIAHQYDSIEQICSQAVREFSAHGIGVDDFSAAQRQAGVEVVTMIPRCN